MLFLLQTATLAVNLKRALVVTTLDHRDYNILNTIDAALELPVDLILNIVLIYRCWVVYGYSWKIICLPILFCISTPPLSIYKIYVYVLELNGVTNEFLSRVSQVSSGRLACNIVTNTYTTTAIVYRIVSVARGTNRSGYLHRAWHIVAESGALYTLSGILSLIGNALFSKNPDSVPYTMFQATVDPLDSNIASVAFNLILIRVYQQREQRKMDQNVPMISICSSPKTREGQLSTIQFYGTGIADLESSRHISPFTKA
ncbi:hypothetical protein AX15_002049 [Amanita polypyramis BW_CC]|nr:hypothetical protein AX15_002049 [Amanita polypyramis BW_CC]